MLVICAVKKKPNLLLYHYFLWNHLFVQSSTVHFTCASVNYCINWTVAQKEKVAERPLLLFILWSSSGERFTIPTCLQAIHWQIIGADLSFELTFWVRVLCSQVTGVGGWIMANIWLGRQWIIPGSWYSFKTSIHLCLRAKIIKNKGIGKQKQSQSLRNWCEVCAGGEVPTPSSGAPHTTSLPDGDIKLDGLWLWPSLAVPVSLQPLKHGLQVTKSINWTAGIWVSQKSRCEIQRLYHFDEC